MAAKNKQTQTQQIVIPKMTGKRVLAHDVVNARAARSGEYPPMIITIPKKIVEAMKLEKGESLRIYTDGERIYVDRFEEPTI